MTIISISLAGVTVVRSQHRRQANHVSNRQEQGWNRDSSRHSKQHINVLFISTPIIIRITMIE